MTTLVLVAACTSKVEEDTASSPPDDTGDSVAPDDSDNPEDSGDSQSDTSESGDPDTDFDPDADGDGYPASTDCDDTRADVSPAGTEVCDGLADRWETPGAAQDSLLLELEAIARRPEATPTVADALTGFGGPFGPWVRRAAALSPGTSPEVLGDLAADPSPVVRQAVALQDRTAAPIVEQLAGDAHAAVRLAVAARPDLPLALLRLLAADPDPEVRRMVAEHPETPVDLLTRLCDDSASGVLCALLRAKALPPKLKRQLRKHPSRPAVLGISLFGCWKYVGTHNRSLRLDATSAEAMDEGIYSHPAFPEPLLAPHFGEQYRMGGYAAARHPFLSPDTLAALAVDSYAYTTQEPLPPDDDPSKIGITPPAQEKQPVTGKK